MVPSGLIIRLQQQQQCGLATNEVLL